MDKFPIHLIVNIEAENIYDATEAALVTTLDHFGPEAFEAIFSDANLERDGVPDQERIEKIAAILKERVPEPPEGQQVSCGGVLPDTDEGHMIADTIDMIASGGDIEP